MDEKAKNDKSRINNLSFLLLWIVLVAGMSQLSHIVFLWLSPWVQQFAPDEFWRISLLNGLLMVAFTAPVEKALLRLRFGQWIKGWISSRFLSMILSAMPSIIVFSLGLAPEILGNNYLQVALLVALSALPQVWILRRYVKHAWLYPIAAVLGSMVANYVASSLWEIWQNDLGAGIAVGSWAAVMALMMLLLFNGPLKAEKAKRAESESFARLEDGLEEDESETEEKAGKEKSMKHRSLNGFMLYQILRLNFWKTWQKT